FRRRARARDYPKVTALLPELERPDRAQPLDLPGDPLERLPRLVALREHRQPREAHPLLRRRQLQQLGAEAVQVAAPLLHRQRLAAEPLDEVGGHQIERKQRAVRAAAPTEQLAL